MRTERIFCIHTKCISVSGCCCHAEASEQHIDTGVVGFREGWHDGFLARRPDIGLDELVRELRGKAGINYEVFFSPGRRSSAHFRLSADAGLAWQNHVAVNLSREQICCEHATYKKELYGSRDESVQGNYEVDASSDVPCDPNG